jgi:hypothetical protein
MTTTLHAPASPPRPAEPLTLDERIILTSYAMSIRLAEASVAFEVRTAHIAGADPIPEVPAAVPLIPTIAPAPQPSRYSTPLADLLDRARHYIATRGLLRGALRDENNVDGARCPIGALRYEAGANRHLADDACVLLLDVIQAEFADAETIPSWVDAQSSPAPVLACMNRAANLAHTRGL